MGAFDGRIPQATSSSSRRSSEVRLKKLPRLRVHMVASHTFGELRHELAQDEESFAARVRASNLHGTTSMPIGEHHPRIQVHRRVLQGDEESFAMSRRGRPHFDEVPLHDGIAQRHLQDHPPRELQVHRRLQHWCSQGRTRTHEGQGFSTPSTFLEDQAPRRRA